MQQSWRSGNLNVYHHNRFASPVGGNNKDAGLGERPVTERSYWLAWREVAGIGPVLLHRIRHEFGDLAIAWDASPLDLQQVEGIGAQRAQKIALERRTLEPDRILEQYQQYNPEFWTPSDPGYPRLLKEIPDAPIVLHYRGNPELLETLETHPGIGIVGTRKAGTYGRTWTERYSQVLSQHDFVILSGLAEGIDAIAHEACLNAGGKTIAVLGNGVDQIYPLCNRKLYDRIAESGLLLSEYPAGTRPDRKHFPARNRIVAGLSRAVLVMEAGMESGSLITAGQANEYGRDVYALAGNLDSDQMQGCIHLISQGAQILPRPEKFLEMMQIMPKTLAPIVNTHQLETQLKTLESTLDPSLWGMVETIVKLGNSAPIDLIIQTTGLGTPEVSSGLLQLELLGVVRQDPGMRYAIVL
jgi:DNA processing protein